MPADLENQLAAYGRWLAQGLEARPEPGTEVGLPAAVPLTRGDRRPRRAVTVLALAAAAAATVLAVGGLGGGSGSGDAVGFANGASGVTLPESFPGLFADPEASGERSFEGLAGPLVCLEFTLEAAGPGCTLVAGSDRFDHYRYSVSTEFGPTESNLWQITQDGRGERVDIGGREGRIDQTNQSVVWEAAGGARVALTGQFDIDKKH